MKAESKDPYRIIAKLESQGVPNMISKHGANSLNRLLQHEELIGILRLRDECAAHTHHFAQDDKGSWAGKKLRMTRDGDAQDDGLTAPNFSTSA